MSPFLQLAFELVIILLAAKAAGYISTRLGPSPRVLGRDCWSLCCLARHYSTSSVCPLLTAPPLETIISDLSELGVLLLMFIAGLELHLGELGRPPPMVSLLASTGGTSCFPSD